MMLSKEYGTETIFESPRPKSRTVIHSNVTDLLQQRRQGISIYTKTRTGNDVSVHKPTRPTTKQNQCVLRIRAAYSASHCIISRSEYEDPFRLISRRARRSLVLALELAPCFILAEVLTLGVARGPVIHGLANSSVIENGRCKCACSQENVYELDTKNCTGTADLKKQLLHSRQSLGANCTAKQKARPAGSAVCM